MYHIFIHSSINGQLGCCHVVAMTNNAAMKIVEHMSLSNIEHLLGMGPRVVFLGPEIG